MSKSGVVALFAAIALGVVAGCGQSSGTSPSGASLEALTTAGSLGSAGGAMTLSSGAAMQLQPNILPSAQNVMLLHNVSGIAEPPNPAWKPEPGVLSVAFSSPIPDGLSAAPPAGATPTPALTLTMPYAKADAAAILAAQAPVAVITYADGTSAKLSFDGTFDANAGTVSVTIPREALKGAIHVQFYVASDGYGPSISPGPRYWNGTAWQTTPITLDPAKKTLVFVHGIFSSVESAFPCAAAIMAAGGYQQAVGLDYDWTQPPYTEAPILSKFVNSLPVSGVDLEAHSYGTVVTLAALPAIAKTMKNVVLLGGPLPLNGSPQADPGYLRSLLINLAEYELPPSIVERAVNSGMVNSLATGSSVLQQISAGTHGLANPPAYIEASGRNPLPFEEETGVYELYELLYGFQPNDGVVEQISAESSDFAQPLISGNFPDDHLQLECDPSIISSVGSWLVQ
jgi:pimeloyl-ACP methyl ester carboxylesterase